MRAFCRFWLLFIGKYNSKLIHPLHLKTPNSINPFLKAQFISNMVGTSLKDFINAEGPSDKIALGRLIPSIIESYQDGLV